MHRMRVRAVRLWRWSGRAEIPPMHEQIGRRVAVNFEPRERVVERWSMRDLHAKAWEIVRDRFEQPLQNIRNQYQALAGTGRTCHDTAETVRAAG